MECFVIRQDILENLKKEIGDINKTLFDKLQNSPNYLYSTEFLKISCSENFLDDIEFLNEMSGTPNFKVRYANMIIRDVLEQVIEFIYLLKYPELIEQFMGGNIETDDFDEDKLIEEYLQFGGKPYAGGRKRISEMASSTSSFSPAADMRRAPCPRMITCSSASDVATVTA